LVFHPKRLALDDDGFGPMKQAVEDRACDAGIVVKNFRPSLEGFVGRDDGGTTFVTLADDLEEQVGAHFIERKIAQLVQMEDPRAEILFEFGLEPVSRLGGHQVVERIDCGGEEHRVAGLAGLISKSDA